VEIVLKLLDWSLPQHWALGLPFLCFMALMCMPAFRDTAQNPKDRDRWLKGLRDNSPAEFYRSVMRGGLDWLDTRLSSLEAQKGPAQKTWSYGLLNITMVLALAYPILAMMVQWLWGHAIDFGGQEMMAASPPQVRIFALVWLGSLTICYFFSELSQSRWSWLWLILAVGIFYFRFFSPRTLLSQGMSPHSHSQPQPLSHSHSHSQAQADSQAQAFSHS
jgi:hypothetical protein